MSIESIKVRDLNTVSTLHDDDLLLVARNTGTTQNIKASDLLLYVSSNSGAITVVKWEKTITHESSGTLISTYLNTPGISGISIDSTKTYHFFGMHKSSGLYTGGYFQYSGAEIPVLAGSASLADAVRLVRDAPAAGTYEAFAFINGSNLYINDNLAGSNNYTFNFSFIGI
jgi:hypothetical protein